MKPARRPPDLVEKDQEIQLDWIAIGVFAAYGLALLLFLTLAAPALVEAGGRAGW